MQPHKMIHGEISWSKWEFFDFQACIFVVDYLEFLLKLTVHLQCKNIRARCPILYCMADDC